MFPIFYTRAMSLCSSPGMGKVTWCSCRWPNTERWNGTLELYEKPAVADTKETTRATPHLGRRSPVDGASDADGLSISSQLAPLFGIRSTGPAHRSRLHDLALVRDHMQTVLALVVPDHVTQVGHAGHDLRRHPPGPAEQPAPAQDHEAPVQRRGKEFIDEPERMAPLVEPHIGQNHQRPHDRPHQGERHVLAELRQPGHGIQVTRDATRDV